MPEWNDEINNFLIIQEFPDTIRRKDNELVILIQIKLEDFYTNKSKLAPSVISIYNVTDRTDDFGKKGHQNEMDSNIS